jgi:hypothetical protein
MNTSFPITNTSAKRKAVRSTNPALSRRSFMRFLTVGAAAIAVEGCGGGGGDAPPAQAISPVVPGPAPAPIIPPAPAPDPAVVAPPGVAAPVWGDIPAITFTQGVPSSFSIADYITVQDTTALTLTLNANPLPAGVTFNASTLSFDYDGSGAVISTDGHVLTAVVG